MSAAIDDGGPAYPCTISNAGDGAGHQVGPREWACYGMTLRDYFAAKVMAANLARLDPEAGYTMSAEAKYAYEWADAMLKARAAPKKGA